MEPNTYSQNSLTGDVYIDTFPMVALRMLMQLAFVPHAAKIPDVEFGPYSGRQWGVFHQFPQVPHGKLVVSEE